ncbi:hypothetical protein BMR07_15015 [Methylococcaceae bacterium CS1]|nr:hypothetical protein BMR07_15015 [Methylococcaceae bacterium CS1]
MRKNIFGILVTYILFINAVIAAAPPGKLQLNGQMFQLLNESIQANSDSISALSARVSTIEGDIATINSNIDSLDGRITTNTTDIATTLAATGVLSDELDALAAKHTVDFAALTIDIATINGSIIDLKASITGLIDELQAELDALSGGQEELNAQTAGKIASLESQIATLSGRVSTLEGFHITYPAACDSGNDTGTGAPWVVCEADENQAWISANNMGSYHAELICQEHGYTTVSVWSGTCGNVCGYCQGVGSTSCSNTGTGPEAENGSWSNFNGGTDELGDKIASTVQWRCVK